MRLNWVNSESYYMYIFFASFLTSASYIRSDNQIKFYSLAPLDFYAVLFFADELENFDFFTFRFTIENHLKTIYKWIVFMLIVLSIETVR